ncbi:hypothetical protein L7F22_004214 [Adiantum nelumboides]|nr:hypothetical protein [Adiantum nelumboides]
MAARTFKYGQRGVEDVVRTMVVMLAALCTAGEYGGRGRAWGMQVGYYEQQCPQAEKIVKEVVQGLLLSDVTAGASLLRLVFHDCQVQACDASILLADDPNNGIESELHSPRNFGIRRLEFIDVIKRTLEHQCPGVVSCADIIVLAARDAIALLGGPLIPALTGRTDSKQAYKALADSSIPPATTNSLDELLQIFSPKGLTLHEIIALLGSHTLGVSHCVSFENRLKPTVDEAMSPVLAKLLEVVCASRPQEVGHTTSGGKNGSSVAAAFNDATNLVFDKQYFRDVAARRGLLSVDASLASDARSSPIVHQFAANQRDFFDAYTTAFLKLTQAAVLSVKQGHIRKHCSLAS